MIEDEEKIFETEKDEHKILVETEANMRLREELKEEDYYDNLEVIVGDK